MYREIHVLATTPPHPNIINHRVALVTISHSWFADAFRLFIQVERSHLLSNPADTPSLERRIRWAVQMASGIYHLHRVAHTYGDIKLDNIVLSANDDATSFVGTTTPRYY